VIARIVVFAAWAIACLALLFLVMLLTQMGDCFDVQSCIAYKQRAGLITLTAVPALWLAGAVFMIYRWNR